MAASKKKSQTDDMMKYTHARIQMFTNVGKMNYIIFAVKIKDSVIKIHKSVIWVLYQNLAPRNKKIPDDYEYISSYMTIDKAESFMLNRISKSSPTYDVIESFFKNDLTNANVISITRKLLDDENKK